MIGYGAEASRSTMNNQLGDIAVRSMRLADDILALQSLCVSYGQSGMVGLGFSGDAAVTDETDPASGDAGAFRLAIDQLAAWAGVFNGTATQATAFRFTDVAQPLTGARTQ